MLHGSQLAASYNEIGAEIGIPVVPVGLVYQDCEKSPYVRSGKSDWLLRQERLPPPLWPVVPFAMHVPVKMELTANDCLRMGSTQQPRALL